MDYIKKISIVIPCYNEEKIINDFYAHLVGILEELNDYCFELIFVDDGSKDETFDLLNSLYKNDHQIKIIRLSRNFGHQAAVTAGMDYAKGDSVIVMDADLQDPPAVLLKMVERWRQGIEVVYAVRKKRKESPLKRASYYLFYRLLRILSNTKIPLDAGDFCLMDRCVVDQVRSLPEHRRFVRGLRTWVGFKQEPIEYERSARFAGKSKYNMFKLLRLAFDGIFSFSYAPLRLAMIIGSIVSLVAFLEGIRIIYLKFFIGKFIHGLAALSVFVLFIGGIEILFIGLIGEYIGRIYDEVKGRPTYIVRQVIDKEEAQRHVFSNRENTNKR